MSASPNAGATASPELDAYWMPFTANRQFKQAPRLFTKAEGMHYTTADGRRVLDAMSGLWCVNAGHARPRIVQAIQSQAAALDYATAFQMGHPAAFQLATRLAALAPAGLNKVFFTNSGSESVDTALKIALAWHRLRGEGGRTRLIGRERGYHGVNFGGVSVGGMVANRKMFGPLLPGVDHLCHTHDPARNAFCFGRPAHGGEAMADDLERLVALHDASTIAAVIVEPVAGSTGVLVPPVGYLERLRAICDRHGILLIFDEVITGFGRVGQPFAAQAFKVRPDLITAAKGLTNGSVPMGAVLVDEKIHAAFMSGPPQAIEFMHGYTYSGHPLACAAALATLDTYAEEGLLTRAGELQAHFAQRLLGLRGAPHVIDVRGIGLMAGIELKPREAAPGRRAFEVFLDCFEQGVLVRTTGDTIALSPPLIIQPAQIDQTIDAIAQALQRLA